MTYGGCSSCGSLAFIGFRARDLFYLPLGVVVTFPIFVLTSIRSLVAADLFTGIRTERNLTWEYIPLARVFDEPSEDVAHQLPCVKRNRDGRIEILHSKTKRVLKT